MGEFFNIRAARGRINPSPQHEWELVIVPDGLELATQIQSLAITNPDAAKFGALYTSLVAAGAVFAPLKARRGALPSTSFEKFETHWGPYTFRHSGKKKYQDQVIFNFEEGDGIPVGSFFYAWQNLILNDTVGVGVNQKAHTADIFIRVGKQQTLDMPLYVMHLYEAYPESISEVPLSYDSQEIISYDISFSFDVSRMEVWPF